MALERVQRPIATWSNRQCRLSARDVRENFSAEVIGRLLMVCQFIGHDCGAGLAVLKAEVTHCRGPLLVWVAARIESPLANHTPTCCPR
jgi:hypothetical protein